MSLAAATDSCESGDYDSCRKEILMIRVLLTGANGFIAREYSSPFTQ